MSEGIAGAVAIIFASIVIMAIALLVLGIPLLTEWLERRRAGDGHDSDEDSW